MDAYTKAWKDANFGYSGGFQDGYFCGHQDGYAAGYKAAISKLQDSLNDLDVPEPQIPEPPEFAKVTDSKGT